ncbi:hypothetical protein [Massilia aquatica]|uniref:Uncharacterized protein n=1 Tax=Massilia aquatica TaxID=2609000 RepID=A0ABX0MLG2_9BURK|nr:hypothetical protein [Massilia aquatica]NHZ44626.1 hypothetical protein [Massilia aquatica]
MAVQFHAVPMTARCVAAVVGGCAALLFSSTAAAAAPAAAPAPASAAPVWYGSAPLLKLLAGTYDADCTQEQVKVADSKRPGGSIRIAEDGTFSSGKMKGVLRDDVSLLRSLAPDGALKLQVNASDNDVHLAIAGSEQGNIYIAVIDDQLAVQCTVPVPKPLQAPTLFSLYGHVLDVEMELSCVTNGSKKKKYPITYRVQQGVLRVFDQEYDLKQGNTEMIMLHMGEYGSKKFTYNARTREDHNVDIVVAEGKFAGVKVTRNDGKFYMCLAPGQTP